METPSADEKASLKSARVDVNGGHPLQAHVDIVHLTHPRFRRSFHLVMLLLCAIYVIRKWSNVWGPLSLISNHDEERDVLELFNWSAVCVLHHATDHFVSLHLVI